MKSFRFAKLLHEQAGLGLKEAWDIKTKVLDEEPVELELPASIGAAVLEQAKALGLSVPWTPARPVQENGAFCFRLHLVPAFNLVADYLMAR